MKMIAFWDIAPAMRLHGEIFQKAVIILAAVR
jgi:hypothetical protein